MFLDSVGKRHGLSDAIAETTGCVRRQRELPSYHRPCVGKYFNNSICPVGFVHSHIRAHVEIHFFSMYYADMLGMLLQGGELFDRICNAGTYTEQTAKVGSHRKGWKNPSSEIGASVHDRCIALPVTSTSEYLSGWFLCFVCDFIFLLASTGHVSAHLKGAHNLPWTSHRLSAWSKGVVNVLNFALHPLGDPILPSERNRPQVTIYFSDLATWLPCTRAEQLPNSPLTATGI